MRERDIHKLIEQQDPEAKQRIWEKIRSQLDLPSSQPQKVGAKKKPLKWAFIAAALLCVITLSVVLPIVLQDDGVRYCNEASYKTEILGQTIKEYSVAHDSNLLYVDWYDVSDETETKCGRLIANSDDIVFFEERFLNAKTGETLKLSVTDNKTRVEKFEYFYSHCEVFVVNNVNISWKSTNQRSTIAMFEHDKNVYYLEINVGDANDRLTEIIQDMLK